MPILRATLEEAAVELNRRAAVATPIDARQAYRAAAESETNPLARYVLESLVENAELAILDDRPMCGDTGLPRYYIKVGNEAQIDGGFAAFEHALRKAVAQATQRVKLRSNRVHPLTRKNPGNNVGVFAPNIDYRFHPHGDWVDITAVHKGGLFGSDYRMLFPGDGVAGIKRFVVDTIAAFHRRGLACPPAIVGVGLGGTKDQSFTLSKEAACLRLVGDRHPDPVVAELELELLELCNSTQMGVMGLKSQTPVADVHCEIAYTHTGGLPVAVSELCTAARRSTVRLFNDGRVEFREDPQWFDAYMRREGVDWIEEEAAPSASEAIPMPSVRNEKLDVHRAEFREVHLTVPLTEADVRGLQAGDVVYLTGPVVTARDGVLTRMLGEGHAPPVDLTTECNVLTTSSPAGVEVEPGRFEVASLQATAGFRYARWMEPLCRRFGVRGVISKGGMPPQIYAELGNRHGVVFLSTMGYGLGAIYGRGVRGVRAVHWKEELGISEAMWVLECERLGPLLVEGDTHGRCFFQEHAEEIDAPLMAAYEGLPPPILSRLGEQQDPRKELARG